MHCGCHGMRAVVTQAQELQAWLHGYKHVARDVLDAGRRALVPAGLWERSRVSSFLHEQELQPQLEPQIGVPGPRPKGEWGFAPRALCQSFQQLGRARRQAGPIWRLWLLSAQVWEEGLM